MTTQDFDGESDTVPTETITCQNPRCARDLTRSMPAEAWRTA